MINYIIKLITAYFSKATFEQEYDKKRHTKDAIKIIKDFISPNRYSRCGRKRKGMLAIELHWVAAAGQDYMDVRKWFEMRKGGKYSYGSTHYIVGLTGDIVQVIPDAEIAFSSGSKKYKTNKYGRPPYKNTLSIEMCHPTTSGKLTNETYSSVIKLCIYLCKKYNIPDIVRHYDLTGKNCPRYFVKQINAWNKLVKTIQNKGV